MKLAQEVAVLVSDAIENGRIVHPASLTQEIVDAHDGISGSDVDWYRRCAFERTRDLVREAIRRLKITPKVYSDPQLTFPGWKHLQRSYSVRRDGVDQGVPIERLTPDEINEKRAELRRMGDGCFEHEEELGRYLLERLQ